MESGTYQGEDFDARQTNIRYNHVAIGPLGWGRAGRNVGLRLDALDASQVPPTEPEETMADRTIVKLRVDGIDREFDKGSDAHIAALETRADMAEKTMTAKVNASTERADKAEQAAEKARKDAAEATALPAIHARVVARQTVCDAFRAACRVTKNHLDAEGEVDDATEEKMGGAGDDAIKSDVIAMVCPDMQFAPEEIGGAFKVAVAMLKERLGSPDSDMTDDGMGGAAEGEGDTRGAPPPAVRGDGGTRARRPEVRRDGNATTDPAKMSAEARMRNDAENAWKKKPGA